MKNNNYICHELYLRNSKAYDHDFWYTFVKWWYLQVLYFFYFLYFIIFFFLLFSFFGLVGGGAVGDKRTKNGLILQKNSVCCTSYLRIHISYNCHLWYACVKWWYLQVFFFSFFFKILILWVVREGVGFSLLRGGGEI